MQLTKHFSLEELTTSDTAARLDIDNTPPDDIVNIMRTILAPGLERVRMILGSRPIHVTSGYRSELLNSAVGGSKHSAHMRGLAADIICPQFGSPLEVCKAIAEIESRLGTDQIIHEYTRWCHVAFAGPGEIARGELLTIASSVAGYQPGLV